MTDYNKRARELCGEKEDTGNPVRDGDCNEWINKAVPVVSGLLERAEKAEAKLNALREIDVDEIRSAIISSCNGIGKYKGSGKKYSLYLYGDESKVLASAIKAKITEITRVE